MRKSICLGALLALLPLPALAAGLSITGGWIRALPSNLPAGGYFTLHNDTAKAVALTGASSPACGTLMLHQTMNMGGMETMDMVKSVPVPAGGSVSFSPGGYHLMCMKPSLKTGTNVPVTLIFADGAKVTGDFAVKDARGK